VGTWRSIDDKTGAQGRDPHRRGPQWPVGPHRKTLRKGAKTVCDECTDDRKGQPMVG
jgi:hypothetical protein